MKAMSTAALVAVALAVLAEAISPCVAARAKLFASTGGRATSACHKVGKICMHAFMKLKAPLDIQALANFAVQLQLWHASLRIYEQHLSNAV